MTRSLMCSFSAVMFAGELAAVAQVNPAYPSLSVVAPRVLLPRCFASSSNKFPNIRELTCVLLKGFCQ